MERIKIIEATNELGLGGTEYVIQLYSKYLNKNHFEPLVVGLYAGGERVRLIEALGVPVIILNGDLHQFGALLKETDVLHWHGAGMIELQVLNTIKQSKPKVVIQTNIFGLYYHSPLYDVIDYDLYVSKMILIRRMMEDRYLTITFPEKRKVLYNPVDTEEILKLKPAADLVQHFKKDQQLEDNFIIGRIGRADNNKFDLITLDGFAEFARHVPKVKFSLVGSTPEIIAHAAHLGITDKLITFPNTPDLKQLMMYYSLIDVYLAASTMGESFGMVIAEAMTAGIPVVTINSPDRDNAQIELVDNRKTGFVVNRDPFEIASALSYLYHHQNLRDTYGNAGRLKVIKEYNAEHIVGSLENLIFNHFQLPIKNQLGTLLKDFSLPMVHEYMQRCSDVWVAEE